MPVLFGLHDSVFVQVIIPLPTKASGYTGFTLSGCLSFSLSAHVCLSICPSVDQIVSALFLPLYLLDMFHFYTSYQKSKIWIFAEFVYFIT